MSEEERPDSDDSPYSAAPRQLLIRNEQMAVFSDFYKQSFEDRMAANIMRDHPERFHETGRAKQLIARAIETGRRYGIETEGGVAVLIQLMICFGENFELSPDRQWAFDMLAHPVAPAVLRISLVRDRMLSRSQGRVVTQFRPEE
jgi:hypothetical protein